MGGAGLQETGRIARINAAADLERDAVVQATRIDYSNQELFQVWATFLFVAVGKDVICVCGCMGLCVWVGGW